MAQGLLEGLNVGLDFGLPVALAATLSNPNPLAGTFDMDDLREHNFPIEHDVSLSRQDFYQGDNLHFNQSVFNEVLSFYSNTNRTTISLAADALWSRIRTKRSLNGDEEIYSGRQLVLGLVETSLYMSLMGDPLTGDAPIDYVKSFFGNLATCWTLRVLLTNVLDRARETPIRAWLDSACGANQFCNTWSHGSTGAIE